MIKRLAFSSIAFGFATTILLISALRTASVKYEFTGPVYAIGNAAVLGDSIESIDYHFPYPGGVLPDSPLWPMKAARDRMWLAFTTNPGKQSELLLLFSDKRLISSKELFERGQYGEGVVTLSKAEKYLERAFVKEKENREEGLNTTETLLRLNRAALAHYGLIEEMLIQVPDDARPKIVETQNYSKTVYNETRNALLSKNLNPVENPFDW